ncbi:hypothetical protein PUATCC27989T_02220 [Phytobacter ursingii]|nr:hypothetical protein PUATCC27989T_02220 [Phytobacter ursingii]
MLMIQAARDGAGIAYICEAMVGEEVTAGQLMSVLDSFSALQGRFLLRRTAEFADRVAGIRRFYLPINSPAMRQKRAGRRLPVEATLKCLKKRPSDNLKGKMYVS